MLDAILHTDLQAFLALNGPWGAGWDAFFAFVSEKWAWIPLYLFILYLIYRRMGWRAMLVSLVLIGAAAGVANEICDILKAGVGRLRPSRTPELEPLVHIVDGYRGGRFGMPSAHAATTAAIGLLSALIVRKKWLAVLLPLWVLLVSYSRIYLGVHYPGDILVGWITGGTVALCLYWIFRLPPMRRLYERGLFSSSRLFQRLFPDAVWHFPDSEAVYLTFDDGPTPEITPWVLEQLRLRGCKATFFCLGKNVEQYPELFQQILDEGHAVGNHTYSHQKGWRMKTRRYVEDVDFADELIRSPLLRPPYGRIKPAQVRVLGERYRLIMWSLLSRDYSALVSPRKCLKNVVRHIEPGAIVVFHDSKKAFRNLRYVLPRVLDHLQEHGIPCERIEG